MKKAKKIITTTAASILSLSVLTTPAYALDWRDGAQASQNFTYEGTSEGIKSVYVQDKNGTINKEIVLNEAVKSKTGTITWRDSYENVTSFYVDVTAGYDVKVFVNGKEGELFDASNPFEVKVNSDLGKDNTYTINGKEGYEKVFYFSSAGKEAWVKNINFSLVAEKHQYSLETENGTRLADVKIGETPSFSNEVFNKEGHHVVGYTINGINWQMGSPITEEMIMNSEGDKLIVKPEYEVNQHTVTVNYFNGGMASGTPKVRAMTCNYNEVLDAETLGLKENQYIVGNSNNEVTVPDEDITINVVNRPTENDLGYTEFAFTYTGEKDPHVQAVTVQWNGEGELASFDLNETAILDTNFLTNKYIKFFVLVDKGYVPTGKLSEKDAEFEKVEEFENNDLYQITFTRNTSHAFSGPICETFTIETSQSK